MQRGIGAGFFEHGLMIVADSEAVESPPVSEEHPPEVTFSEYALAVPVVPDSEGFVIVALIDEVMEEESKDHTSPKLERATVSLKFPTGKLVVADSENDWRVVHEVEPGQRTVRVLTDRHLAPERVDLIVS